jgi:hypothetical protein
LCGDIYLNLQIYIEYFYYTVMLMQIHEKEINQEQEEIYRNIMDRSMTWSRSVVFSWYSGYLHDITEILLKVGVKHHMTILGDLSTKGNTRYSNPPPLKWSLVTPDVNECCIRYSSNFWNFSKKSIVKNWYRLFSIMINQWSNTIYNSQIIFSISCL